MAVLYSKPFYRFIEHLIAGDFTATDEITVAPCFDVPADLLDAGDPAGLGQAEYLDVWSAYIQAADAEIAPLTITYPVPNIYQWEIPDVVFTVGTTISPVMGLLFYWDTGVAATSPLIGFEFWDSFGVPIPFTSGVPYTWFAPDYLIRWTME